VTENIMQSECEYTVPEGKWPLQDTGLNGKAILKQILERWDGKAWPGLI
jgi:hypothetical protein